MKAKIIDYGYNGEGVAKIDGKIYFIPKTIIGEEVEFSTTKENSKFCNAKLEKITSKSNLRISPPCKYFDKCGGCCFQHLSYEEEIKIKKMLFLREFCKIQKLEDIQFTACQQEFGYRNKLRLSVKNKDLGFFEEKSKNFLPVENCMLVNNKLNNLIKKTNHFLKHSSCEFKEVIFYDFDDTYAVDFITDSKDSFTPPQNFCNILLNHKGQTVPYRACGLNLEFNGDQFRQVNNEIAKALYDKVKTEVKNEKIINAYSGAGLLSALLAQKADQVYGIELNKSAHLSAEKLKLKNNITNLANICGYAEKELPKYIKKCSCLVVDPPRAGCDKKLIDCILASPPKKIIYISCNPSTLVRDLKMLKNKYEISGCELFDMFPKTANVEALIVFNILKK